MLIYVYGTSPHILLLNVYVLFMYSFMFTNEGVCAAFIILRYSVGYHYFSVFQRCLEHRLLQPAETVAGKHEGFTTQDNLKYF